MFKLKQSGISDFFSVSPEAQNNLTMQERTNAINTAVMALRQVNDSNIQAIVQQLQGLLSTTG